MGNQKYESGTENTRRSLNPRPGCRDRVRVRLWCRKAGKPYIPASHRSGQDFPMDQHAASNPWALQMEDLFRPRKPVSSLARKLGRKNQVYR